MSIRLVPKSVTLNDTERRNGVILRYFTEFSCTICRRKTIIGAYPGIKILLLIFCDHINTICGITQRLFWQNKRRQWPSLQTVVAYAHVS